MQSNFFFFFLFHNNDVCLDIKASPELKYSIRAIIIIQNIQVSDTHLQGHRAELYAARVAKCLAAMEGREKVFVDDLKKAVKYTYAFEFFIL